MRNYELKQLKGKIERSKLDARILREIIEVKAQVKVLTEIIEEKGVSKEEIQAKYDKYYDSIAESVAKFNG